jgi:hypothetical protein
MVGLALLVGLTVMISLLGAMLLPSRTAEPPLAAAPPTLTLELPLRSGTVALDLEPTPIAVATPTETFEPSASLVAPLETTPEPVEFVRVGNTDRQGAFIRREPRAGAPGIVAHRDGTPFKVVGPDVLVDGRPWRNVEDERGNRGWIAREYLLPSTTGF